MRQGVGGSHLPAPALSFAVLLTVAARCRTLDGMTGDSGRSRDTVGVRFETGPNALNFLRLCLASTVVVWHAYLLPGHVGLPEPAAQLLERIAVDCFFAISGFLIVRSWQRNPEASRYLRARAGRILPALWVCLLLTAFVIVPAVARFTDAPAPSLGDQLRYVVGNAGVFVTEPTIGAPWVWNVSLWTLWWEVSLYLAVLALGIVGWLRPRVLVGAAVTLWSWLTVVTVIKGDMRVPDSLWLVALPRVGLMFTLGALLWVARDRVPMTRSIAVLAAVSIAAGSFLPQYLVIAAPGVAYLSLWVGISAGRWRKLRLRNDLSYGVYIYGAPVQAALVLLGVSVSWGWFTVLSLALVLPVAALSWFLIERPALSASHRVEGRGRAPRLVLGRDPVRR